MRSADHPSPSATAASGRAEMARRYAAVRAATLALAQPLSAEDQCVQSMPDASPTKWHLAHTSWFFEAVVLQPLKSTLGRPKLTCTPSGGQPQGWAGGTLAPAYQAFDPHYAYLFNSYYEALGPRHPRPQRGLLTRPPLAAIHAYRAHVDAAMQQFLATSDETQWQEAASLVELGLNHEEQHQELIQTDILHLLSCNPLLPAYQPGPPPPNNGPPAAPALQWLAVAGDVRAIGHGGPGFAFDNETPRHQALVHPFQIASRLVTCGEYLAFMLDGGYRQADWWLSDGWAAVQSQGLSAPAYWLAPDDPRAPAKHWQVFGPHGVQRLDPAAPVTHVSFYEACAFAEWSGARLPTEFEWEVAFDLPHITQMLGHCWQWTRSAYEPYPGFRARSGAVREYNGKFMVGQQVLRGASSATPAGHGRKTYRNFFPPAARWQISGIRLAKDTA